MKISKAVITLAHPGQKHLPLQHLTDRDGKEKTALQVLIEEARHSGIDSIALVICPDQEEAYGTAAAEHREVLHFVAQTEPLGYGDALLRAREFVGDTPFLHMVGDHLPLSDGDRGCARQLIELAEKEACAVSGVQSTPESLLPYYGVVGGKLDKGRERVYAIDGVKEKPSPTVAEQELVVPGLRAGYYLCFFGMHVFPASVMTYLEQTGTEGGYSLSRALGKLVEKERYLALELMGRRFDLGVPYGLFMAQMAFAMKGKDRNRVLTEVVEILAAEKA